MTDATQPNEPEEFTPSIPPPPPVGTPPYMAPPVSTGRPVLVTVVAVVLLVFAGLTAIGLAASVISINAPNPSGFKFSQYSLISDMASDFITVILYIIMGIGLLRLAPWSRAGAIWSLIVNFILSTINATLVVSQILNMPMLAKMPKETMLPAMIIGLVIGLSFVLIINGLMIIALTRPNVVEAFRERK